jgi:hypothetical protein
VSSTIRERVIRKIRLDQPEPADLGPVVVRRIVVIDADAPVSESAAAEEPERVPFEDGVTAETVAPEVRLQLLPAAAAEREIVDPDEVAGVPEHRRDEAEPLERADLDVALSGSEQRRGEIQEREVVLLGKPAHILEDRREAPVARVLRARVTGEETRQLTDESVGIHDRLRSYHQRRGNAGARIIEGRMTASLLIAEASRRRAWLLAALVGIMVVVTAFVPPVPQDPAYHHFADARPALGVPNFLNVVSNLAFLVVGALGLGFLARDARRGGGAAFGGPAERRPYWPFFTGVTLTAVGSGYYHWQPDNGALFWDRLPMTLAFMALLASVIGERISGRVGARLLWPLLLVGGLSALYWHVTEQRGAGTLRPRARAVRRHGAGAADPSVVPRPLWARTTGSRSAATGSRRWRVLRSGAPPAHGRERAHVGISRPRRAPTGSSDARAAATPGGRCPARPTQPRRPAGEDRARREDGARPVAQPVLLRTRARERPREGGIRKMGS